MRIQLGKKGVQGGHPRGQHKGLISVIAGPDIPRLEGFGHGQLRKLFAIPKNPKFGLPREDFFAAQKAGVAAQPTQAVIGQYFADELLLMKMGGGRGGEGEVRLVHEEGGVE